LEQWCEVQAQQCVQFDYWLKTLSLEIVLLLFVRAFPEGNFPLYLESLTKIIPWMFALDHIHYSHWLPVHIRDCCCLLTSFLICRQSLVQEILLCTKQAFDHCHEQNNAIVKDSGGAIGLTNNPMGLKR